jgi:hypothetical protein
MEQPDGAGDAVTAEAIVAAGHDEPSSLDGFGGITPESPLLERPELIVGAAFLGGLLLAGLVARLGR